VPSYSTTHLLDLAPADARDRLASWCREAGLPGYRAGQLHRRLWVAPGGAWRDATELPLALRDQLERELPLPRLALQTRQHSRDGTVKYLWRLPDQEAIESVLIPSGSRRTLCISSQVGCALGCVFCATGRMGFRRNLAAWEITAQVRELALEAPGLKPTNIVFMGMGEPLLNWPAVNTALSILNQPDGFGIGARHITVSTVGIVPALEELARRPEQFRLALSLHGTTSASRRRLMPVERKYDLEAVLGAAKAFTRRVTFEYVMIAGANDTDADASRLASLARKLGAMVNLLPLHPGGDPQLEPTPASRIREFAGQLRARGIEAVVRRSRGLDIDAACGQLYLKLERKRRPAPAR